MASKPDEPVPSTGLIRFDGGIQIAAASRFTPEAGSKEFDESVRPGVLVILRAIDDDFLVKLSRATQIRNTAILPPHLASLPAPAGSIDDAMTLTSLRWGHPSAC